MFWQIWLLPAHILKTKFKSSGLSCLMENISRQYQYSAVAWLLFALTYINSEIEQKNMKNQCVAEVAVEASANKAAEFLKKY